ncbi:MAG TPA: ATPase, T2SS/T4P/T4SS family [Mycobacteriales bacterium]|nr:ATPase, T2SS/T4P/T4SS family [Mycobacteriales bacterium]
MSNVVELVEAEVREQVRRRRLDPVEAPEDARALVEEVLAGYAARVPSSALPPLGDRQRVARAVLDAVAGFGPLQRWFDDPEVEEIWINEPGKVFVARRGRSELTTTVLTATELRDLVERMLRPSGRRLDVSAPFVDATLPDGSRLHVVIPDVTRRHMAVNVRKFQLPAASPADLVRLGTLTPAAARFLEAAVVAGLTILVSGGTQSGKTTTLNCLLAAIPPRERLVTVEEVFELRPALPDWVAMQTRQPSLEGTGEITLRRLITEALRMRPSRLVVGEVRQAEALDLLLALNSGVPGLCTLHANSARQALVKACTLPLLAGGNIGAGFVVPTVAGCVDLVVHLEVDPAGRRRVREIVGVPGRVEGAVIETAELFGTRDERLVRRGGEPPRPERFARVGIDVQALLAAS